MTDLSESSKLQPYKARHKIRFITAAALFDGHDASINIMRRILQSSGTEVIHLGHNRSVGEIVSAALQEDVQGIAITSYQGGHIEYFKYMIDLLRQNGAGNIKVFGGGGGVIVAQEVRELHEYGVARVYSPEDGAVLGLQGMINDLIQKSDFDPGGDAPSAVDLLPALRSDSFGGLARVITALENGVYDEKTRMSLREAAAGLTVPALGITGTGGAGKSSLADELVLRLRLDQQDRLRIAVLSIDPSRRRGGGALLGDRIRMNAIDHERIFMRSLATRDSGTEVSAALPDVISACKIAGFDLIIVETSGIGQGNAAIVPLVDVSLYVMTPEVGAASQLEKIDMLDLADFVAINKFDRKGAEDALRDVRKQYQRNRGLFSSPADQLPVFGTQASRFNDDGITALYQALIGSLQTKGLKARSGRLPKVAVRASSHLRATVPPDRARYLAEIAQAVRAYHEHVAQQARSARERQSLRTAKELFQKDSRPTEHFDELIARKGAELTAGASKLLEQWPTTRSLYAADEYVVRIRDKEIRTRLVSESLSGSRIPKVALPKFDDEGEILRFLMKENVPGSFPFTAGVFAFKRENEDPTRMFAGEGDAFRTNKRFHMLADGMPAKRLNTAIDQQLDKFKADNNRDPTDDEAQKIKSWTLSTVRGTVQADILKEDQGQNTCIFSTEFSLKVMGDIQSFFVHHNIKNFYSVSISGYHIAEAGANPISQLAFTLSNGFTFVEAYLARGMHIDDFAPNLSFFFSNGMDPEYTVLGRVARRIWAVAMREKYGANDRSQKLKYHIQTSGRSLHAQEIDFNDIRTTLQALYAIYDNCNSLHTNAYDEAITTPTEESVRRAMAIQLIINRELGSAKTENFIQGSFIIEELTDLVEEAVLTEFDRLTERGGVLGAMERMYQRNKIQEESLYYEHQKHTGELPLVGVNSFLNKKGSPTIIPNEVIRSTKEEKEQQVANLRAFWKRNEAKSSEALKKLRQVAINNGNLFSELMETVKYC